MSIPLKIPSVGESVTEVEIGEWLKKEGDPVAKDENVVVIETEKATVELPAPEAGRLSKILKPTGAAATVDDVIGEIEPGPVENRGAEPPVEAPAQPATPKAEMPAAIPAEDEPPDDDREEEVVPLSLLRRKIGERLVAAQQTAALLTTFNEIDLTAVQQLRHQYQAEFQKKYMTKLGLMAFFVKASIEALKEFPGLNAAVRGRDIVYHNYFDIGIAIAAGKGLVVPVLRRAERLSFAGIEAAIATFAARAKANELHPEDLTGGTFTITNGGVFGSLLSTPIINPPQSGILGLHAIQDRPVAVAGQVVIRPMMYAALTYDHRVVDGREAVTWLRRVKEIIETPARLLLEV